jgi:hypothetical protein
MPSASLWLLRKNVGLRTFYEGLGGTITVEKGVAKADATLRAVAYGWLDIMRLI